MTNCKLSPLALGLALGVLWGGSLLLLGLLTHYEFGGVIVASLKKVHVIYDLSFTGILAATLIGFVDGFFRGAILGWLYNVFAHCCCNKEGKCG